MRRRAFVAILCGSVVAGPRVLGAQEPQRRVPLIGALWQLSGPIALRVTEAFQRGLRENGYLEGRNITIENRYGVGADELRNAANELVHLNVDLIVAAGTAAALAAKRATNTIPIVGVTMADPVSDGLVAGLARPEGNVTGNTFLGPELGPKRLQMLREIVPGVTRAAALQHPGVYSERTMRNMLTEMEQSAKASGIDLQVFSAIGPNEFDDTFERMIKARAGALIIFPSPMFYSNYLRLVGLAAIHRLPTMYAFREAVEAGGLVCYGADIPDLFRLAAKYVAKILKGAKPGDLPVEQPTKFELLINLKTAKALDLTVSPSLLATANEVIE